MDKRMRVYGLSRRDDGLGDDLMWRDILVLDRAANGRDLNTERALDWLSRLN